jgi:hypothetical protein
MKMLSILVAPLAGGQAVHLEGNNSIDDPGTTGLSGFKDPESKVMLQNNKGREYSGNAQAMGFREDLVFVSCFSDSVSNHAAFGPEDPSDRRPEMHVI